MHGSRSLLNDLPPLAAVIEGMKAAEAKSHSLYGFSEEVGARAEAPPWHHIADAELDKAML
jgi:hypothetical protein